MSLFQIRDYRHLFGAQLVALGGNGLATVALGLLAFQLAGARAGAVLGTALTIKMVVYVIVAPIAGAYAGRFSRRRLLVGLDLTRAAAVAVLPFVDQIWQVYVLVAVLQSASAAFTPTFQAVLPDILPDANDYTRALSYSQLASTMETLLSPLLAAVLVTVTGFHWLFAGTAVGFLLSAAMVVSSRIPDAAWSDRHGVVDRIFSGMRIFAATPRLRGLLGLNLAVAAVGAIVIVNTVNLVQQELGRSQADVAWLLAANGAGVLVIAFVTPRLLVRFTDRTVMLSGATALAVAGIVAVVLSRVPHGAWWPTLFFLWALIGVGTGAVLTPAGEVLRRSSSAPDRPALFAAQFSLSHACWLIAYPIAGWVATAAGFTTTWIVLSVLAVLGVALAWWVWPSREPEQLSHFHAEPVDHDHVVDAIPIDCGYVHSHPYVIDKEHRAWPRKVNV
ncbi:MFS transporter [Jongsikchunia kroppenstedtii]|uniref:MFS transporter n=1 Tax=Jongsikchunia kroppenstedtii TaxID=1121721 RepID=UPI0003619D09|nr:MFS transporter [Jongsikchunia kroppenstedtii]